jgi:hypothetical protein
MSRPTSFTISTNGTDSAYRKVPKNSNDTSTIITASSTMDGVLYTELFRSANNTPSAPVIHVLNAGDIVRYRVVGQNMEFIAFRLQLAEPAEASLTIGIEDHKVSDAVTLYDSAGRGLTSTNGALNVAISDTVINVDISVHDNMVIYGKNPKGESIPIAVNELGRVLTIPSSNDPVIDISTVYQQLTHVSTGTATDIIDTGTSCRHINLMGQSGQKCTLKVRSSPDQQKFYDTIYSCIVNGSFSITIPPTSRYIQLVPNCDVSLSLKYYFISHPSHP